MTAVLVAELVCVVGWVCRLEVEQLQAKLAKDEAQLARCTKVSRPAGQPAQRLLLAAHTHRSGRPLLAHACQGLVLFSVPHVARERTSNLNRAFAALAAVAASQASSAYCAR